MSTQGAIDIFHFEIRKIGSNINNQKFTTTQKGVSMPTKKIFVGEKHQIYEAQRQWYTKDETVGSVIRSMRSSLRLKSNLDMKKTPG